MALEPISTSEAAQRLGVTATTVRRMIAAGRLQAIQEERPQGARFRVLWESHAAETQLPRPQSARSERPVLDELTYLRTRIEAAARRGDPSCERFGEPPQPVAVGELEPASTALAQPLQASPEPAPRRPFWRRLWRRRA